MTGFFIAGSIASVAVSFVIAGFWVECAATGADLDGVFCLSLPVE
jgi:hypothetical protein